MKIHADLTQRVVVDSNSVAWIDSPLSGVSRKMIERDGDEIARATSIVRYAPGASFATHMHALGEEIIVLDGAFTDEMGRYERGCYIKNPPGSAHAPQSESGCTLFVKLRHLAKSDSERVVVETASTAWYPGMVAGLSVMPLSEAGTQHAALVRWAPNTYFSAHRHFGGEEIYVLEGVFADEHGRYPQGTWLRSPHLSMHQPFSVEGCTIFVKTGHLLSD